MRPIPGGVQGQVVWSLGQPDLVGGISAYGRGVRTRWSLVSLPPQAILSFYDIQLIFIYTHTYNNICSHIKLFILTNIFSEENSAQDHF